MPKVHLPADNPCALEHESSLKCLSRNHYDKDKCALFFANYTNCQKFWTSVRHERKRNGISPELPPAAERDKIKAEHIKTKPE
ncbi:CLUMA_CG009422, isoform A [Clunio marinus]|uniref:Coiled-coil-helix-coiled-coil-helix domain-containing protein 7 n=1 Tax=Clunio marinus TaxID=568069 RepID=A0A1J1I6R2_9DIPT|nr:CLUMA_CG009422, isoform A [Clunio marinus]